MTQQSIFAETSEELRQQLEDNRREAQRLKALEDKDDLDVVDRYAEVLSEAVQRGIAQGLFTPGLNGTGAEYLKQAMTKFRTAIAPIKTTEAALAAARGIFGIDLRPMPLVDPIMVGAEPMWGAEETALEHLLEFRTLARPPGKGKFTNAVNNLLASQILGGPGAANLRNEFSHIFNIVGDNPAHTRILQDAEWQALLDSGDFHKAAQREVVKGFADGFSEVYRGIIDNITALGNDPLSPLDDTTRNFYTSLRSKLKAVEADELVNYLEYVQDFFTKLDTDIMAVVTEGARIPGMQDLRIKGPTTFIQRDRPRIIAAALGLEEIPAQFAGTDDAVSDFITGAATRLQNQIDTENLIISLVNKVRSTLDSASKRLGQHWTRVNLLVKASEDLRDGIDSIQQAALDGLVPLFSIPDFVTQEAGKILFESAGGEFGPDVQFTGNATVDAIMLGQTPTAAEVVETDEAKDLADVVANRLVTWKIERAEIRKGLSPEDRQAFDLAEPGLYDVYTGDTTLTAREVLSDFVELAEEAKAAADIAAVRPAEFDIAFDAMLAGLPEGLRIPFGELELTFKDAFEKSGSDNATDFLEIYPDAARFAKASESTEERETRQEEEVAGQSMGTRIKKEIDTLQQRIDSGEFDPEQVAAARTRIATLRRFGDDISRRFGRDVIKGVPITEEEFLKGATKKLPEFAPDPVGGPEGVAAREEAGVAPLDFSRRDIFADDITTVDRNIEAQFLGAEADAARQFAGLERDPVTGRPNFGSIKGLEGYFPSLEDFNREVQARAVADARRLNQPTDNIGSVIMDQAIAQELAFIRGEGTIDRPGDVGATEAAAAAGRARSVTPPRPPPARVVR